MSDKGDNTAALPLAKESIRRAIRELQSGLGRAASKPAFLLPPGKFKGQHIVISESAAFEFDGRTWQIVRTEEQEAE